MSDWMINAIAEFVHKKFLATSGGIAGSGIVLKETYQCFALLDSAVIMETVVLTFIGGIAGAIGGLVVAIFLKWLKKKFGITFKDEHR